MFLDPQSFIIFVGAFIVCAALLGMIFFTESDFQALRGMAGMSSRRVAGEIGNSPAAVSKAIAEAAWDAEGDEQEEEEKKANEDGDEDEKEGEEDGDEDEDGEDKESEIEYDIFFDQKQIKRAYQEQKKDAFWDILDERTQFKEDCLTHYYFLLTI